MKEKAIKTVKALVASYALSMILVLLTAFIMYKFKLSEAQTYIGIIAIYAVSSAFGGFLIAKSTQSKRLVRGILMGALYFLVLTFVSLIINKGIHTGAADVVKALAACMAGGALGGIAG